MMNIRYIRQRAWYLSSLTRPSTAGPTRITTRSSRGWILHHGKAAWALLIRLALGSVFIQSGFAKITHRAMAFIFFANLGFGRASGLVSVTIPWIEMIGGIALIGGVLSRIASFVLIGDMTVAIIIANPEVTRDIFKFLRFYDFLYILLLMGLVAYGPGRYTFANIVTHFRSNSRSL